MRFLSLLLKIVAGLIVLLFIFIGLGLLAGYYYLDPNLYKDEIIALVKEETGRTLVINSRIEKSIYPSLGLKLGEISLSNPEGYDASAQFFEIDEVQIGVRLMPIFSGRIEAEKIRLSGMRANLIKNEAGKGNWEDLLEIFTSEPDDSDVGDEDEVLMSQDPQETEEDSGESMAFFFQGIEFVNAGFSWSDATTGQNIKITDFDVVVPVDDLHQPFPIKTKGRFALNQPNMSGEMKLSTQVTLSKDFTKIDLDALDLMLQLKGDAMPSAGVDLKLGASVKVDTQSMKVDLNALTLALAGVEMNGEAHLTGKDPLAVKGKLTLAKTNPRALLTLFGHPLPKMKNANSVTSLAGEFSFAATPTKADLTINKLTLDSSELKGTLAVLLSDPLGYRFDIELDQFNMDDYLPEASTKEVEKPADSAPFALDPALVEMVRELNIEGQARVKKLIMSNLTFNNIVLSVSGKGGVIKLNPISADLYEGTFRGNSVFDFRQSIPTYTFKYDLNQFQVGPFSQDLIGEEKISGVAQLALDIKTNGMRLEEIKKSLNGQIGFEFKDGAVSGINIAQMIRTAQAKLKGLSVPEEKETKTTDFSRISGTIHARDGILENTDLSAYSPLLRVNGVGKLNLLADTVDYLLTTTIVGTAKGQGGADLDELKGISIPLRLSGPMLKPGISLDLKAALSQKALEGVKPKLDEARAKAEDEIEKKKKELEKKLQDKLQDKLPSKLKGLFN